MSSHPGARGDSAGTSGGGVSVAPARGPCCQQERVPGRHPGEALLEQKREALDPRISAVKLSTPLPTGLRGSQSNSGSGPKAQGK